MNPLHVSAPRERLTWAIDHSPDHLRPIMLAVRDHGVSLCLVPQGKEWFSPPDHCPAIVLVGDDLHQAMGPKGFHRRSLVRFAKRCSGAVIVACAPLVTAYASAAASAAGLRQDVILIETRPEFEADWKAALEAANPDLAFIIATIEPVGGIH